MTNAKTDIPADARYYTYPKTQIPPSQTDNFGNAANDSGLRGHIDAYHAEITGKARAVAADLKRLEAYPEILVKLQSALVRFDASAPSSINLTRVFNQASGTMPQLSPEENAKLDAERETENAAHRAAAVRDLESNLGSATYYRDLAMEKAWNYAAGGRPFGYEGAKQARLEREREERHATSQKVLERLGGAQDPTTGDYMFQSADLG